MCYPCDGFDINIKVPANLERFIDRINVAVTIRGTSPIVCGIAGEELLALDGKTTETDEMEAAE